MLDNEEETSTGGRMKMTQQRQISRRTTNKQVIALRDVRVCVRECQLPQKKLEAEATIVRK